jgi:hypothetical protein
MRVSSLETVIQNDAAQKLRTSMLGAPPPFHLFAKRVKKD